MRARARRSSGFKFDPRVIRHEPPGFLDYSCLQMNAFCVVSVSGTFPEESSFYTGIGHPVPAVCIRTSAERPEAPDKACFFPASIQKVCCRRSIRRRKWSGKKRMEKISLSIKEWVGMVSRGPETDCYIPVWFRVTGDSMYPFIRANTDDILLLPAKQEELNVGDIVLFPGKFSTADYCLHRLYKMDGDTVQTFGDGNLRPDPPFPKKNIIGKAVLIKRGKVTIDCKDPKWIRRFNRWNSLWKIRRFLLIPFRIVRKLKRMLGIEKSAQNDCI